MAAGQYAVQVAATPISLSVSAGFTITVADTSMPPPAPPAPPPPAASFPNGTYLITSGGNAVDGGFGYWGSTPAVQLYPTNSQGGQQWVWNGSTLSNVPVKNPGQYTNVSGPFMADAGDGTVTENATGDTWTVSASGNGYTIRDKRTGHYLSIVSNALAMSATQTVWTIAAVSPPSPTAITLTPASVTTADNAPAGTLLATATVTMSDGSQFAGTLTTSNTDFFAISGLNIVTAKALTPADDGTHTTVITASQGSKSLSMSFSV